LFVYKHVWFPVPEEINRQVTQFLQFEKEWLSGALSFKKIISILIIPVSLFMLALAFWKRNVRIGLGVLVLTAVLGLLVCVGMLLVLFFKKHK